MLGCRDGRLRWLYRPSKNRMNSPGEAAVRAEFQLRRPGESQPVEVRVAMPIQSADGFWSCEVSISGTGRLAPIQAEDGLQALALGLDFVRRMLESLTKRGDLFYAGTEERVELEAYFPERE